MDISFNLHYDDKNAGTKTDVAHIQKGLGYYGNPLELANTKLAKV